MGDTLNLLLMRTLGYEFVANSHLVTMILSYLEYIAAVLVVLSCKK